MNLLNPGKNGIGGGGADAGDILFEPLKRTPKDRAMPIQGAAVSVVPAQLGTLPD